ncbi:hypothetical protein BDV09DRAFT_79193 [Aspergillus tetrazonus]
MVALVHGSTGSATGVFRQLRSSITPPSIFPHERNQPVGADKVTRVIFGFVYMGDKHMAKFRIPTEAVSIEALFRALSTNYGPIAVAFHFRDASMGIGEIILSAFTPPCSGASPPQMMDGETEKL